MARETSVTKSMVEAPDRRNARLLDLVSVIVPVVERADDLLSVYEEFGTLLEPLAKALEFLFVFDGSFGRPPEELVARSREDTRIRIFCFDQAFGEAAALRVGIEKSRGDVIVTVPAYFQVLPEAVNRALDALESGADLVVTRRFPRRDGWLNRLQSRLFHLLVRSVSGVSFRDMACGVRAMRRDVAESIPLYGDLHRFIPALAIREGFSVVEVDVPQHPLDVRRRLYRPGVYMRRLLDIVTFFFLSKFTEKPLRFFGFVGSLLAAVGVAVGGVVVVQRFMGRGAADRPLLLLGVLLVALGVQLVGLGLVGEIIVHLRAPQRRTYRVRETI